MPRGIWHVQFIAMWVKPRQILFYLPGKKTVKIFSFLHRRPRFFLQFPSSFMVLWKHRRPRYFPVNSRFLFSFSCDLMSFIIGFHTKQQYPQICEIQTLTIIIVCRCWMSSSSSTNLFVSGTYFFYIYTYNNFHVILVLFIRLV